METLSGYIRKFGKTLLGQDDYKVEEIKIFFAAPKPQDPSSETLTIEKNDSKGANFSWVAYQVLFSKGGKDIPFYYIYSTDLESSGKESPPNIVFESDSDWSGKNKGKPDPNITPGDVKRALPKVLKGPNLFPQRYGQTIYVNTSVDDKGKNYSSREFKKYFDNDFYVVLEPGKKELKNPFGNLIGMEYPKEEERK